MNAPRDLGPDFRAWLDDVPPMPPGLPTNTLTETRQTRQRRHWLWFLPGPKPTAGADDRRDQATPTTIDHRTGGTSSMFSATKLFAGAAAVALLGMMALSGPIADPAPETASTIGADPGAIARYTGTLQPLTEEDTGTIEVFDWGSRIDGARVSGRYEMDDPRVSGVTFCTTNAFVTDRGAGWLRAHNCRLFNEEGSWHQTSRGYMAPRNGGIHYQSELVGEGAYDGLFAIQRCDMPAKDPTFECEGAVFQGGFPDTPADAPESPPGG